MNVFIDTNVLVDVVAMRGPFFDGCFPVVPKVVNIVFSFLIFRFAQWCISSANS